MKRILFLFLFVPAFIYSGQGLVGRVKADFRSWDAALQTVAVDFVAVPKGNDIQALADYLKEHGYWEESILFDPWGNLYRFSSDGKSYTFSSSGPDGKFSTPDDLSAQGAIFEPLNPPEHPPSTSRSTFIAPSPRSPDTELFLIKSGTSDILFNWTGAGTAYNITGAVDPSFLNAYLLSKDNAGPSYTYANGLTNPKTLEFFSVTDNTGNEPNPAEDANGNLPPVPPAISSISGSWYIGGTPSITGTDFSTVSGDNLICFPGGYCIRPTTATATQLNLIVPPGAISGPLTVGIGLLQSNNLSVDISLEDPSFNTLNIRTIGFAPSVGDYYSGSLDTIAGTNQVIRHYYNTLTNKWAREDRSGSYTQTHYCSTVTDRNGREFCGMAAQTTGGGGTRYIATASTDPMTNCFTIPNPGPPNDMVRVVGIAADPNPSGIAGRDVFYAMFDDTTSGYRWIKKMATDCTGIIDPDWGNRNGIWNWNVINGAAVDPKTGDLYIGEKTAIRVVRFATEAVESFKTGFTNIYNLAVWRDPGNDFGVVLVADFGAGNVKSIPIDNSTAPITILASGTQIRAVCTGLTTYDEDTYLASDLIRLIVTHNDIAAIKLRKEPFFTTDPYASIPANIWISSRLNTVDRPQYQGVVRYSTLNPPETEYSTVRIKAYWADGKNRTMCGALGDALSAAFYEPVPSGDPPGCKKPWKNPIGGTENGACDNRSPFELSKVGSTTSDGTYLQRENSCGGSTTPCWFEFRITQRYAGDNYRFYAYGDQSNTVLSSALITAWKRVFIEQDKMCRRGGVLWEDLNKEPDAQNGDSVIYLAKNPDNTSADNVQLGDIIRVFDTLTPYETSTDRFCVKALFDNTAEKRIEVTLADVLDVNCLLADSLTGDYDASVPEQGGVNDGLWTFNIGKSAGVCVEGPGFFNADTSYLNRRDKPGAFDDGFTSFNVHPDGVGVAPYLPGQFLAAEPDPGWENKYRFQQHWFKHRTYNPPDPTNFKNNYWHLMSVSSSTVAGEAAENANASFVFIDTSEQNCWYTGSPPTPCTPAEKAEYCSHTAIHEIAHQDEVNICATGPHDSNNSWCGDTGGPCVPADARCGGVGWCVMNVPTGPRDQAICQRVNGIRRFDCNDLSGKRQTGSPYCQAPQCACPTPSCTDPNQEKSIRSAPDPQ
jgi:hypothetical protein